MRKIGGLIFIGSAAAAGIVASKHHILAGHLFPGIVLSITLLRAGGLLLELSKDRPSRPSRYTVQFRIMLVLLLLAIAVTAYFYFNGITFLLCIVVIVFENIIVNSTWFLERVLRRSIKRGNVERAGKVAQELYFDTLSSSYESNRSKKKRRHTARVLQLLAEYREAIGDYYVANLFYEWATADVIKGNSRYKGDGTQVRVRPIINIFCAHIRILLFFDPPAAQEKIGLLKQWYNRVDDPKLIAKFMAIGISNPLISGSFKSLYVGNIDEILLQKQANDAIEGLRRNISIDKCLLAWQLAEQYYKKGKHNVAIDVLNAIVSNTSFGDDIRFLFISLDAYTLKTKILSVAGFEGEYILAIEDFVDKVRRQLAQRAALGNEYALLTLSAKISSMIRAYLLLYSLKKKDGVTRLFEIFQSYKGISLDLRLAIRRAFGSQHRTNIPYIEKMNTLRSAMSGSWADDSHNEQRFAIKAIELQDIETYLIKRNGIDQSSLQEPNVLVADIKAVLTPQERFCQIIRSENGGDDIYLGLILDKKGPMQTIELGTAYLLDEAIENWRDIVAIGGNPPYESKYINAIQTFLIEPLLPTDERVNRLIINAEGMVNLLSFDAFYTAGGGARLIERFEIIYVDSAKDLLKRKSPIDSDLSPAVVFAGPDFDMAETSGVIQTDRPFIKVFKSLGYTIEEGHIVSDTLRAKFFKDKEATAINLKQIDNPCILHIATHAFSEATSFRDGKLVNLAKYADPMARCGLAMAGINAVNAGYPVDEKTVEDGMISALEVFSLNIRNTQLVVLSACETGLGRVHSGEGMLGLRSAFKMAGARTVINSLWKADDQTTRLLMEEFYRNILDGQTVSYSLRMAKLKIYTVVNPSPYFWALFVCYGLSIDKVKINLSA